MISFFADFFTGQEHSLTLGKLDPKLCKVLKCYEEDFINQLLFEFFYFDILVYSDTLNRHFVRTTRCKVVIFKKKTNVCSEESVCFLELPLPFNQLLDHDYLIIMALKSQSLFKTLRDKKKIR